MASLITRIASSYILVCLVELIAAQIVVERTSEKLTAVPQNVTVMVTRLDLSKNEISVLHNNSFNLFEQIISIKLNYNPIWTISNGTFDNNPLLREFYCYACQLKLLPASFGPVMSKMTTLDLGAAISDTGILITP